MSTYSLSITGATAPNVFAPVTVKLSDDNARTGSQQSNAATGAQFLCKNLDGSQSYYRLDAERSTPANPILVPV